MRRIIAVNCLAVVVILMVVGVAAPSVEPIPTSLPLPFHTRVTLRGQTLGSHAGQHMNGHIFATASWNRGSRYVVATPRTDALGRWRVMFNPSHRGLYDLRIRTPDSAVLQYEFSVR
ncbi:MAG TPA: hypothetical protein VGI77_13260 [Gaiellaceae bacterium]|jgi:hypothetical protein